MTGEEVDKKGKKKQQRQKPGPDGKALFLVFFLNFDAVGHDSFS
jgi:hypothetical protein